MFNLIQRPYHLLLITAIIVFVVSFLVDGYTVDVHIRDTYYVFSGRLSLWLLAAFLLSFWLLYLFTFRFMRFSVLTLLHIILTIIATVILLLYINEYSGRLAGMPRRYTDYGGNWKIFALYNVVNNTVFQSIALLLIAFVMYIVNLLAGVVRRRL